VYRKPLYCARIQFSVSCVQSSLKFIQFTSQIKLVIRLGTTQSFGQLWASSIRNYSWCGDRFIFDFCRDLSPDHPVGSQSNQRGWFAEAERLACVLQQKYSCGYHWPVWEIGRLNELAGEGSPWVTQVTCTNDRQPIKSRANNHPNRWKSLANPRPRSGHIGKLYSVRGLERSELGGSHGCPGRLWVRFLWQVYQNDSRHDALDGV